MAVTGGQFAVTAAPVSIAVALGLANDPAKCICKQLILRYNEDGTADAFIGGSTVAVGPPPVNAFYKFQLVAANLPPAALTIGNSGGSRDIDLRELFVIGTANAANLFFCIIVY